VLSSEPVRLMARAQVPSGFGNCWRTGMGANLCSLT